MNDSNQTLTIIILNCILKSKFSQTECVISIVQSAGSVTLANTIHSLIYIYTLAHSLFDSTTIPGLSSNVYGCWTSKAQSAFAVIELSLSQLRPNCIFILARNHSSRNITLILSKSTFESIEFKPPTRKEWKTQFKSTFRFPGKFTG